MSTATVKPFKIDVPQAEIDELNERLSRTRWPEEVPGEPWSMGTDLKDLKALVSAWEKYDWRGHEAELNKLPQFVAEVDGVQLHFIHVQSKSKDATPLLLSHGWPDSFLRFQKVIPLLTDHFHLVIPSIPGFGFSEKKLLTASQTANLFAALMTQVLGYQKFMAAGGDAATAIHLALGQQHADHLLGLHLTDTGFPTGEETNLTEAERKMIQLFQEWWDSEGAYAMVQSTKPQSVGVALDDSPAGLAAWMLSFIDINAQQHDIEGTFGGREELLTNLSLYWFTRTATSAARWYWVQEHSQQPTKRVEVPTTFALFPGEMDVPREWINRKANLVRYAKLPRGGHFTALQEPELFADDLKAFKGALLV